MDAAPSVPAGDAELPGKVDGRFDAGHPITEVVADAAAPPADASNRGRDAELDATPGPLRDAAGEAGHATLALSTLGNADLFPGSVAFYASSFITIVRVVSPAALEVAYFATIGKENGGAVRMALYAASSDDPAMDRPTKRLAITDDIAVTGGVVRGPPTTRVELVAGKSYWIALASAASTPLNGVQLYQIANSSTVVYRTPETPFPNELTTGLTRDQGPDFNFFLLVRAIGP